MSGKERPSFGSWGSGIRKYLGDRFGRTPTADNSAIYEQTMRLVHNLATGEGPFVVGRHPNFSYGLDGKPITGSAQMMIAKWDDGNGNPIYTTSVHDPDIVKELAERITAQRVAFNVLEEHQRAQIETEFGVSGDKAVNAQPYFDLLRSEILGRRYEALAQREAERRSRRQR